MLDDPQAHARFVAEVIFLISGTIFIVIGLVALVVAAIRRRAGGWRPVLGSVSGALFTALMCCSR